VSFGRSCTPGHVFFASGRFGALRRSLPRHSTPLLCLASASMPRLLIGHERLRFRSAKTSRSPRMFFSDKCKGSACWISYRRATVCLVIATARLAVMSRATRFEASSSKIAQRLSATIYWRARGTRSCRKILRPTERVCLRPLQHLLQLETSIAARFTSTKIPSLSSFGWTSSSLPDVGAAFGLRKVIGWRHIGDEI